MSKTNRKKSVFPQKQSKREEGVGCLSIRLFRPLVLKKASFKAAGRKRASKTRTLNEKERIEKRGRKSTETESFIFPSKREERKTTCILTKESVIKLVNSLKRALSKKKREVRERLLRSRKAE